MKSVFGDLMLDWRALKVRRSGAPAAIHQDTADLLEALIIADGLKLSAGNLWKSFRGKAPFDGEELEAAILQANGELMAVDAEMLIESFSVRLVDVTPRGFLKGKTT